MKVKVIIPVYNESSTIGTLVKRIKSIGYKVLVIDDGSKDFSGKIASEAGATVIYNEKNEGQGASIKKGFEYISKENYDAVVIMDGDGQHDPDDIPRFIRYAEKTKANIIIGNRMDNCFDMPIERYVINRIMSTIISLICRQKIPDSQCGFKLIRRDLINKLKLKTRRFDTASEILIKSAKLGFKIHSLPIAANYNSVKSSIKIFPDTLRFVTLLLKTILCID